MSMFIGEYFTHESIYNIIPLPASFLHKFKVNISYPSKLYSDKVLSNRKFFGLTSDTAITLVFFFINSESLSFSSESLSVVSVSTLEKITVNER